MMNDFLKLYKVLHQQKLIW